MDFCHLCLFLVLLWMKEVVVRQCWVDRYKLCHFKTNMPSVLLTSSSDVFPGECRDWFSSQICAFAAHFFQLLWWQPEDRSVRFRAKMARSPTCPQSEWRSQAKQVPEKRLSEGRASTCLPTFGWLIDNLCKIPEFLVGFVVNTSEICICKNSCFHISLLKWTDSFCAAFRTGGWYFKVKQHLICSFTNEWALFMSLLRSYTSNIIFLRP